VDGVWVCGIDNVVDKKSYLEGLKEGLEENMCGKKLGWNGQGEPLSVLWCLSKLNYSNYFETSSPFDLAE